MRTVSKCICTVLTLALLFTGCSAKSGKFASESVLFDLKIDGFERTSQASTRRYRSADSHHTVTLSESSFPTPDNELNLYTEKKTVTHEGVSYIVGEYVLCADGRDENGNWYGSEQNVRDIIQNKRSPYRTVHNEYCYSTQTSDVRDDAVLAAALDVVNAENFDAVFSDPASVLTDYQLDYELSDTEWKRGNVILQVSFQSETYDDYKTELEHGVTPAGREYWYRIDVSGQPFAASIVYFEIPDGTVSLCASMAPKHAPDEDTYLFLNAEFVDSIISQLIK